MTRRSLAPSLFALSLLACAPASEATSSPDAAHAPATPDPAEANEPAIADASGETADERSDIFSLGVMVVEALDGQRPFDGDSPAELLASIFSGEIPSRGATPADQALQAVLERCLARDPADRFPSIEAMQEPLISTLRRCAAPQATAGGS